MFDLLNESFESFKFCCIFEREHHKKKTDNENNNASTIYYSINTSHCYLWPFNGSCHKWEEANIEN